MSDNPPDLREELRRKASELGFCGLGFAEAGPLRSWPAYSAWLSAGHHAGMSYLARNAQTRRDPAELLGGVRTILVAAAAYPVNPVPGRGYSSYARGRDYHVVLRDRMRELAALLEARRPGTRNRVCVDSAPLVEREWAVRAGLGWIGRQGQLIHPQAGACVVLCELLTDVAFEPDTPLTDGCGACDRCIRACPTGAILPDRTIDCRRCLSYLTVESPLAEVLPPVPTAARPIFGCDACTAVCPHNPRIPAGPFMHGLASEGELPNAKQLEELDEVTFCARYRNRAFFRTGLARLRRNARWAELTAGLACQRPVDC